MQKISRNPKISLTFEIFWSFWGRGGLNLYHFSPQKRAWGHARKIAVSNCEDSILTIEQEFGGQINNELYYARIPDLDKISLELLENELLKVKYSNQEKIINKNDSLNDELLLIVDDKEYKIKITIKNFGLIDKTQIKTRHPLE